MDAIQSNLVFVTWVRFENEHCRVYIAPTILLIDHKMCVRVDKYSCKSRYNAIVALISP